MSNQSDDGTGGPGGGPTRGGRGGRPQRPEGEDTVGEGAEVRRHSLKKRFDEARQGSKDGREGRTQEHSASRDGGGAAPRRRRGPDDRPRRRGPDDRPRRGRLDDRSGPPRQRPEGRGDGRPRPRRDDAGYRRSPDGPPSVPRVRRPRPVNRRASVWRTSTPSSSRSRS